jgi:membrane protein involved in colicin uptake
MSWIDPNSKLRDLLKTAEAIVEEDKKAEFAAAEVVRLAAELKAKQDADAKAAVDLKAKQEADAKAAAELKAKQEADAKAAALKKTTITCVKGKLVKKVTAVKPKCPTGYKVKK